MFRVRSLLLIALALIGSFALIQTPVVHAQPSGIIPPDVQECINTGNCTVDDIVKTGVGFANFLLGLSGALFFLIFIYGGARYLLSFGNKASVEKGTAAIKGAAIGIVIVMGAWTMVRYITTTIAPGLATPEQGASGTKTTCVALGPGFTCQSFGQPTDTQQKVKELCEAAGNECRTGYCPGGNNIICSRSKL